MLASHILQIISACDFGCNKESTNFGWTHQINCLTREQRPTRRDQENVCGRPTTFVENSSWCQSELTARGIELTLRWSISWQQELYQLTAIHFNLRHHHLMTVFSFSLEVGAPNFSFPVVAIVVYTSSMHDRSVVLSMNRTPSSDHSSSRLRDERNTHITGIQSCRPGPRKMQFPPYLITIASS
jgi:hypothetical protein